MLAARHERFHSKSQEYRAEVRRNYEEFEDAFATEMEWRDKWAANLKKKSRKKRQEVKKMQDASADSIRVAVEDRDPGEQADFIDARARR